jgi:subtilisin family serine protease
MRTKPLVVALLLACAGNGLAVSSVETVPAAHAATARSVYIVEFAEPPLATYRGDGARLSAKLSGLKATSPVVTGARKLDVDAPASRAYRQALGELRAERLAQAEARLGRKLQPRFIYEVVNNGVALELSADEAAALQSQPGVARVTRERVDQLQTDAGPRWIKADLVWNGVVSAPSRGEGIVLGLVDSGINRTHPAFQQLGPVDGHAHANPKGRLFGRCATAATASECNNKLIGIYDFTTSNSEETDNGADVTGHGTHVAGTAVGNVLNGSIPGGVPNALQVSGVAPHGNLISYKACEGRDENSTSTCQSSWTLAAINQAVADGVDVINYSIGGTARDPWQDSGATAMLSAREAGVVVVVAAGNAGPEVGTLKSPGDAPWVIGVAAASHDRTIRNSLVDMTGGATPPPNGGVLHGAGATGGIGPRRLVIDPLFPGCGQGTDLDSEQTGISNPWPAGRFNGEIVVCERGTQARVAKSNNVRLAGGGGMILVNRAAEGEDVVADQHSIPTVHLGFTAGQALKQWMATGSNHSGRITGAQAVYETSLGDILASFSGRGPALTQGILKPDVSAPGVSVFAAGLTGSELVFKNGTSMATPHVSGAAMLISQVQPAWNPSQVESALVTTARDTILLPDLTTPATPYDQGAGMIDVSKAVSAPLAFHITPAEFRNARPSQGGVPRNLNRPSIVHEDCFATCSATRTVTANTAGSWRIEFDLPAQAVATSSSGTITLAAGQSATLTFNFDVSNAAFPGSDVFGRIKFVPVSGNGTTAEVPVALFSDPGSVPARFDIATAAESGYRDFSVSGLAALSDATFTATDLVEPVVTTRALIQDTTPADPFDSFTVGSFVQLVTVPAAGPAGHVYKLVATTRSPTAWDVDLYVGEDLDGNGLPDEDGDEERCTSGGTRADEDCELEIRAGTAPRTFWVLAQNFDAGVQGGSDTASANDQVTLETALVALDGPVTGELTATGPGHLEALESFNLRVAFDDPGLLPGERRVGFVRYGASPLVAGQVGESRIEIRRTSPGENAAAVLAPNATRHMRLAAGAAQDRLYLDVPPNATALTVSTSGTGEVDLYLAREPAPTVPAIAAAPARGQAAGTSIHPGASESVTLTGAALQAGRWYVTPVNPGAVPAEFDLNVSLQYGGARPAQKFGPYYNPQRSGAGLFLYPAANGTLWSLVWYTYLQDGTPTWYLGVANAPGATDGVWRVEMSRYSWDGTANAGTVVGEAQLALTGAQGFAFSWNLDGQSGSEPMTWLDGGGCPQSNGAATSLNGMWYSPARSGFGYAINAWPGVESNALYFYDEQGIARWALGSVSPFGATSMPLTQYRNGFCPLCAFAPPTTVEVGTLTRRYDTAAAGNIAVALQLQSPLNGSWNVDLPAVKLTDGLQCQ